MHILFTLGAVVAMAAAATSAVAANGNRTPASQTNVGMLFTVRPSVGMHDEFEAGYKRHIDWHRRNKDSWAWPAWEFLTGEHAGAFLEGTFGHEWSGFDKRLNPKDDAADHKVNVDPFLASHVRRILVRKDDVSRGRPLEGTKHARFLQIVTYSIRPGMEGEFEGVLAAFHQATGQIDWHKSFGWYEVVDGGALPSYLLVIPVPGFAAMAPSEETIPQLLSGAASQEERKHHLAAYRSSVLSVRSELLGFRDDLSYLPESK